MLLSNPRIVDTPTINTLFGNDMVKGYVCDIVDSTSFKCIVQIPDTEKNILIVCKLAYCKSAKSKSIYPVEREFSKNVKIYLRDLILSEWVDLYIEKLDSEFKYEVDCVYNNCNISDKLIENHMAWHIMEKNIKFVDKNTVTINNETHKTLSTNI